MSITYNDLISRAEQVRDESEIGANTATRVGQLLADIIQWCQDNNADLGDYLLNFTAHLNERGGILNWFQSRIVLLKTMGSAYDDVSVGSLSDGDVYYDSHGNWIREKQGSTTINGIHPSKGVFYVNLANQTAYQWNGTTFQVAIESGSGGGDASTVTAFEDYEVVETVANLPEQGNPTTGYIVGTHIYIYVGEGGDTADGKYQDLGELSVNPDIYQPRLTAGTGIAINGSQISVETGAVAEDVDLPVSGNDVKEAIDAATPTIDPATGKWVIGGEVTSYPSRGEKGDAAPVPYVGQNGNWWVGGVDTEVPAQGPAGDINITEGSTPTLTIVKNLNTEDDAQDNIKVLSAGMGKRLNLRLAEIEGGKIDTEEDGFFVIGENGNIGMQYDEDGLDVALLSQHFIALLNQAGIGSSYKSQCVVRFLPFLSAWDDANKNSLCLCSTKQQLVDNKVPFYDGYLFHKLPTDDKSLWYGTTLDNAVQIGTLSVYPNDYQLAMSPKDGRVIAAIRGNGQQRADLHVWDGTTDTAVAAVSSDGNSRKPLGWLYNCGYDFIKNGNNEYMIFAEYNGDGTDKGGYYVWKGTYPYTSPSNWKTVFHRPYAGKTYGTIAYGTIAHFHMVRRDPWANILYLAAGDYPTQLIWWYSTDYGETWTELTNNETNGWEQHVARACNMVFTKDYIYWANDHGVNHCLNRVARNAQTGIIDPSTREKLCDLRFGQACNSICYVESPHGLFMYERIDTGDEFSQQYGTPVKMYFWDIDQGKLYEVANVPLLSGQTWGGSRGKCYLHYTSGQQPRPAMGFSDDTRCIFDIAGSDGQNIGTIYYEL